MMPSPFSLKFRARARHTEPFRIGDGVWLLAGDTTYTPEWHINFDTPLMITQVQNGVRSGIGRFAANKVPPVDF